MKFSMQCIVCQPKVRVYITHKAYIPVPNLSKQGMPNLREKQMGISVRSWEYPKVVVEN